MKKFTLILLLLALYTGIHAQSGTLDSTFAGDGILKLDISVTANDPVYGVVQQPDGKIIFAGYSTDAVNEDCFLYRVLPSGSTDITFGNNGKALLDAGLGADDRIFDMILQPDGKIIAVGTVSDGNDQDLMVVRLDTSGNLDPTFGPSGIMKIDPSFGEDEIGYSVAIQDDGKIVVVGYTENLGQRDLLIARFNIDGSLDTDLDVDGMVSYDVYGANDQLEGVAITPDGKIAAAGSTFDGQSSNVIVIRLDNAGQPDLSFSTDGKFTADLLLTESDQAMDLAIYPDGKIIVAGFQSPAGASDGLLFRLNENGILDNTFGASGKMTYDVSLGNIDRFSQVILLADGKILAGGYTNLAGNANDYLVIRTESNGDEDTTFNSSGWAAFDAGGDLEDGMRCMNIQDDGKILLGGYSLSRATIMRVHAEDDIPQGTGSAQVTISGLNAWPVPFSSELSFELPAGSAAQTSWELIALDGRTIVSGVFENTLSGQVKTVMLPETSLTPGFYLFRLTSQGRVWTQKVMSNPF